MSWVSCQNPIVAFLSSRCMLPRVDNVMKYDFNIVACYCDNYCCFLKYLVNYYYNFHVVTENAWLIIYKYAICSTKNINTSWSILSCFMRFKFFIMHILILKSNVRHTTFLIIVDMICFDYSNITFTYIHCWYYLYYALITMSHVSNSDECCVSRLIVF